MTLGIDVRRLTVAVLATVALFIAIAAAAPKADAFSTTKSGDHYTVTITKAEVVGGAASAICKYYAGNYGWLVWPPLARDRPGDRRQERRCADPDLHERPGIDLGLQVGEGAAVAVR